MLVLLANALGNAPSLGMKFVENVGQLPADVVFYTINPQRAYLTSDARLVIGGASLKFGSPRFILGDRRLITKVHYFVSGKNLKNIPTYRRVVLKEAYPKTDVVITAEENGRLEVQFFLKPGADPKDIAVEVDGAELTSEGIKVGNITVGGIEAFQGAKRVAVEPKLNANRITFKVGDYDPKYPLIIDPVIAVVLATRSTDEVITGIAYYNGNLYVSGYTSASAINFNLGSARSMWFGYMGRNEAFVAKCDNTGCSYMSILTSSDYDEAKDIAIDADGNVFVVGTTFDFESFASGTGVPKQVFYDPSWLTPDSRAAFVAKLSPVDLDLIKVAILPTSGGNGSNAFALAISPSVSMDVYVVGDASNGDDFALPNTNPNKHFYTSAGSHSSMAFAARLDNNLNNVLGVALIGGDALSYAKDIDLMGGSGVFVVGSTTSSPSTFSSSRTVVGTTGNMDAFGTVLSSDLSSHLGTILIATSGIDVAFAAVYNPSEDAFYMGGFITDPTDIPSANVIGPAGASTTDREALVSKFTVGLSGPSYQGSAILASSYDDKIMDMALISGAIVAVGYTEYGPDFVGGSTVIGATGEWDAFLTVITPSLTLDASRLISSDSVDVANAITSSPGYVHIAGYTRNAPGFATTPRNTVGISGGRDGFITTLNISGLTHSSTLTMGSGSADQGMALDVSQTDGRVYLLTNTDNLADYPNASTLHDHTSSYSSSDIAISVFSPDLTNHLITAYVGGDGYDYGYDIDVDEGAGLVYIAGETHNAHWGITGTHFYGNTGGEDAFVMALNMSLSSVVGLAILGSDTLKDEAAYAVDHTTDNVVIAGYTDSSVAFISSAVSGNVMGQVGRIDGFISFLQKDLSQHDLCFILAGQNGDIIYDLHVNENVGLIAVGGDSYDPTNSNFLSGYSQVLLSPATYTPDPAISDGFISIFDINMNHIHTAILASSDYEAVQSVLITPVGVYAGGYTYSADFATATTSGQVYGPPGTSRNSYGFTIFFSDPSDLSQAYTAILAAGDSTVSVKRLTSDPTDDEVFAVGYVDYNPDFLGGIPKTLHGTTGEGDVFVARFVPDLTYIAWADIVASPLEDYPYAALGIGDNALVVSGHTFDGNDFSDYSTVLGSPGYMDAFLFQLYPAATSQEEKEKRGGYSLSVSKEGELVVELKHSAYVGYDVYNASGRLILRHSEGYLTEGTYALPLPKKRGAYMLKVRVGKEVRLLKIIH